MSGPTNIPRYCVTTHSFRDDENGTWADVRDLLALEREVSRLCGVLAFYAEKSNWRRDATYGESLVQADGGKRAREALEGP